MDITQIDLLNMALILTRLSAFFLSLPVFGWKAVPTRIKISIVVLLTIFFGNSCQSTIDHQVSVIEMIILMSNEAIYGLALSLIIHFMFAVVRIAGRIIERQMGMAMAQVLDPLSGESAQPLSIILDMIFILLFLSVRGHHIFIAVIHRSYEIFPIGKIPDIATLTSSVTQAGSLMLSAALRLSAPLLALTIIMMIILGIMARIVPEMNILFISFPIRIALGLMMVTTLLPFINGYLDEFTKWLDILLPL